MSKQIQLTPLERFCCKAAHLFMRETYGDDVPERYGSSLIRDVRAVLKGGLRVDGKVLHDAWVKRKLRAGKTCKENPSICSWRDLPYEEKVNWAQFRNRVLSARSNFQCNRLDRELAKTKSQTPADSSGPLVLAPGRFYRDRQGAVWCCYAVHPYNSERTRALCVRCEDDCIGAYCTDGRYVHEGEHSPHSKTLVERAGPC